MPRKGITGHDEWVITEALATALIALEQLPPQHQRYISGEDCREQRPQRAFPVYHAVSLAKQQLKLLGRIIHMPPLAYD
jgi:hypothetical protein